MKASFPLPIAFFAFLSLLCAALGAGLRGEDASGGAESPDLQPIASAAMPEGDGDHESAEMSDDEAPATPASSADSVDPAEEAGPVEAEGGPGLPPGVEAGSGKGTELEYVRRSNFILSKLLGSQRFLDPFGMSMDPSNTKDLPVLAEQFEDAEETPALNSSSLKLALQRLPVTGVYPKRQILVVGARSFSAGDELGLRTEGLTLRLRFEGIREHSIFFRDMETNEVTSVEFNTRPAEFEPILPGTQREPGEGIQAMSGLFIAN